MQPWVIRRTDGSDADYAAIAAVTASAPPAELTDFESVVVADLQRFDAAFAANGQPCQRYLACQGGGVAGVALLFHIPWLDAPGSYWLTLRVAPAARRQGAARALERQIAADLNALRPQTLWLIINESNAALIAAAQRRGFGERLRTNPLTLDLATAPALDPQPFVERLAASGLTVRTLAEVQRRDPGWLDQLHALHMQLTREVPLPEELFTTPEEFRAFILEDAVALPDAYFLICDGATYVGQSFMQPQEDAPRVLRQELTGTLPAYRGRGVALALKALTIDYAQRHGYHAIQTWVESNNPGMLAINTRFGFISGPGNVLLERRWDDRMTG